MRAAPQAAAAPALAYYSWDEIKKHKSLDDIWVVISGDVYDITTFLPDHPGGKNAPMLFAGSDATEQFLMIHKPELLAKYGKPFKIGRVKTNAYPIA